MGAVTPTITSEGKALDSTYQVISIDIRSEVNRIPYAELRILDGSASKRTFDISESKTFEPGAKIEIKLRRETTSDVSVFKGIVVRHRIETSESGSVLVIGVKDEAVKLTGVRKSAVYSEMADSDIIKQIISDAELTVGTIIATTTKHPEMVQYNCSPWDFILSRADVIGMLVAVEAGTVSLKRMASTGSAVETFEYGIHEIYEFELEADAEHQYTAVQSVSWDPKTQKMTSPVKAATAKATPGNMAGDKFATAVGNKEFTLAHPVIAGAGEMQLWASSRMARSRMAMVRGRLSVPGFAPIKLLDVIELLGLGKRWTGTTVVTGLHHMVDRTGWRTDLQLGLAPEEYYRTEDIHSPAAAGLLPAVSGLQIGVVAAFQADPNKELRVKVILPGVDAAAASAIWARVATLDAGKARGIYFRPEPGDEVVVGFLNDDPRNPVILGSLWSSANTAPTEMGTPDAKNLNRGIVTKSGTSLTFLDEEGKSQVLIKTKSGNQVLLDDKGKAVSLTDQAGNSIVLDKNGVTITSKKKFTVNASADVVIKGSKVDVQ
jgi:Rhs element Vgr protein